MFSLKAGASLCQGDSLTVIVLNNFLFSFFFLKHRSEYEYGILWKKVHEIASIHSNNHHQFATKIKLYIMTVNVKALLTSLQNLISCVTLNFNYIPEIIPQLAKI